MDFSISTAYLLVMKNGWTLLLSGVLLTFLGASATAWGIAGQNGAGLRPLPAIGGLVLLVAGIVLARFRQKTLHHTVTDPIGCVFILVGLVVLVIGKLVLPAEWSAFILCNGIAGIVLGVVVFARDRKKGFH